MTDRVWFEELRQDTRLALYLFRRRPAFFAAVVLTLAVGIGANGAVFSILQSALLQPLPYRNPEELVMLRRARTDQPRSGALRIPGAGQLMTSPTVLGWRHEGRESLGDIAVMMMAQSDNFPLGELDLSLGDRVTRLKGGLVTPNFFSLLGARASVGRVFNETDVEQVIVLSDALWKRDFSGDPSIVGRPITIALGTPRVPRTFTVIGILPKEFHFTYPREVEAWVLIPWSDVENYSPYAIAFSAVARLRPGLSVEQARRRAAELPSGAHRIAGAPSAVRDVIGLEPIRDWVVGETRPSLRLLGAVAALLLLITCVTVCNSLLARISERQQELAVRAALGASRARLVRQLLTEGVLLSVAGALAGTLAAAALQPVLRALLPASIPRIGEISINASIVAFGAAMAAMTTILAAVAPAWGGAGVDAAVTLSQASSFASAARSNVRWRQGLIAAQAAIATALLICASLLLTSFWKVGRVSLGFNADHVVTTEIRLAESRYTYGWAISRFQETLIASVRAVPGVSDVGFASAAPFRGLDVPGGVTRSGDAKIVMVKNRVVDEGFFRALRIAPIRGRLLSETDRFGTPAVTVVSESYARQAFGTEDPVGKTIESSPAIQIVGVVPDLQYAELDRDPAPAIYSPRAQSIRLNFWIIVRTQPNVELAAVTPAIRRAIREIDPRLPSVSFVTVDQLIDASVANRRFYTVATVSFASIALLLTVVGLIVVIARVVAERRRELAIRAALGATVGKLAQVATRDAMVAVSAGLAVGLLAAYAASVGLEQFLFRVEARSPAAYVGVTVLVMSVAAVAAWGPVRRFDRASLAAMLKSD